MDYLKAITFTPSWWRKIYDGDEQKRPNWLTPQNSVNYK